MRTVSLPQNINQQKYVTCSAIGDKTTKYFYLNVCISVGKWNVLSVNIFCVWNHVLLLNRYNVLCYWPQRIRILLVRYEEKKRNLDKNKLNFQHTKEAFDHKKLAKNIQAVNNKLSWPFIILFAAWHEKNGTKITKLCCCILQFCTLLLSTKIMLHNHKLKWVFFLHHLT